MEKEENPNIKLSVPSTTDDIIDNLLEVTRKFLFPCSELWTRLLLVFVPTFEDKKHWSWFLLHKIFLALIFLVLLTLTLPLAVVFIPVRITLLSVCKPYQYSVQHSSFTNNLCKTYRKSTRCGKMEFGIATANILLLPEYASRWNNIKNVHKRSVEIGDRIVIDQFFPRNHLNCSNLENKEWLSNNMGHRNGEIEGTIRTHFSNLDFLCIQEAFSNDHTKTLIKELHKAYPYIVYDVGVHSVRTNMFLFNSGLMIASRHRIVAIEFKPFRDFVWPCTFVSQGLLMTKVVIEAENSETSKCHRVGYIFNLHLQAYQGTSPIIPKQLDAVLGWADEFILKTKESGDHVLFSAICGDFNCDNMSPADRDHFNHPFFKIYNDFGRVIPGKDKDWTVASLIKKVSRSIINLPHEHFSEGTEMRQKTMLDPLVSTPKGLKVALEDPSLRRQHILDANIEETNSKIVFENPPTDEQGNVLPSAVGGKRRIDLITFNLDYPVQMKSYDFVTRLASLTDHIPVQTSFSCPL